MIKYFIVVSTAELEFTSKKEGRVLGMELEDGVKTNPEKIVDYLVKLKENLENDSTT